MRRSDPLRSDPDKLRAWQQRSRSNLARAGRLRQRSPRKKDRYDAIATACGEAVKRDHGRCQAFDLLPAVHCFGDLEVHHLFARSARPDLVAEVANLCCLCHEHHAFVTDHPAKARAVGLRGMSGDTLADLAERRHSAQNRSLRASGAFGWRPEPDGT